ncbi:hypothetical protein SSX86_007464 [Deinandra increscens subsp. villosa]|uniref:TF-B3 domain-containing protein n=1 Tax=Deinandra increscens subsp. villosa TaxID=3103831 RepID=A0AAP0H5S1_9ASTR
MKIVNIEDIQATDPENAIEADGIHAIAAASYKQVYDAPLELLGCYRIGTFACEDPPVYLKTIDHPVSLRFGSTAVISPIPDSVIYPRVYFDFTKHTITATLWKEIILSADRFNRAELDSTTRPCTIALTAVKVTKHRGWFQLTSTPGTYTYINPGCAESATLLRRCEAKIADFAIKLPWFKRNCLKIPDEFAKVQYGNQQAAASVSLIFTTNMFWDIKIKRIGEDVYMMNGWSQVVRDIPLRENHFLEFIYASDSVVRLQVYSEDGSNILSVPTAVKSESESNYSTEEAKDPPTFNKRLPTELADLASFHDGMKIRAVYEHAKAKTLRLRSKSNMVTYTRFTIRHWERFADRYAINVGQKIRLTYDFQTKTLFMQKEN